MHIPCNGPTTQYLCQLTAHVIIHSYYFIIILLHAAAHIFREVLLQRNILIVNVVG